ncbi:MAG: cytochrome c biogenesis protein [Comamonadaceae bacterium]|nr:cytochrome c biogenesis protein [Comamonadaceae bacterium]
MPLLQLERLTFRFVEAGFVVLTRDAAARRGDRPTRWRWDHKTVFSLLGWAVFAALLAGRHWRGWRGRRATRWLYAGAALLLLAYAGSRFVLRGAARARPARHEVPARAAGRRRSSCCGCCSAARRAGARAAAAAAAAAPTAPATMVACAHCGVHLPRDEAVHRRRRPRLLQRRAPRSPGRAEARWPSQARAARRATRRRRRPAPQRPARDAAARRRRRSAPVRRVRRRRSAAGRRVRFDPAGRGGDGSTTAAACARRARVGGAGQRAGARLPHLRRGARGHRRWRWSRRRASAACWARGAPMLLALVVRRLRGAGDHAVAAAALRRAGAPQPQPAQRRAAVAGDDRRRPAGVRARCTC